MAKTLIAYFSRADENYFGGAMRYVKVGNTELNSSRLNQRKMCPYLLRKSPLLQQPHLQ